MYVVKNKIEMCVFERLNV